MKPRPLNEVDALIGEAHQAMHGRRWPEALAKVRRANGLLPGGSPPRLDTTLLVRMLTWFEPPLDVEHLAGVRRRGDSLARAFAHAHAHLAGDLHRLRRTSAAKVVLERCEAWLLLAEGATAQ